MKNIKIYMLLAATMLMVAACGSDDDDLGGTSGSGINQKVLNVNKNNNAEQPDYNTPIFSNQCISQINFVILHSQ